MGTAAGARRQAVIGTTVRESRPAFPPAPRPGPGAPNVLVIVLDDLGFAQLGCYGSDLATPALAPQSKRAIGMFAFDRGVDGVTDLSAPIPTLFALPFITGGDVFLPATTPPDASIRIETVARGGTGVPEVLNVPNWASATDHVSVMLRDFSQADDTFPWRG